MLRILTSSRLSCVAVAFFFAVPAVAQNPPATKPGSSTAATSAPPTTTNQSAQAPAAAAPAKCVSDPKATGAAPTLDIPDPGALVAVTGKLAGGTAGTHIQVCVNNNVEAQTILGSNGSFTSEPINLAAGDKVTAQTFTPSAGANPETYGPLSAAIMVGKCSVAGGSTPAKPTLDPIDADNVVSGSLSDTKTTTVRVCVNDQEVARAQTNADGGFAIKLAVALTANQQVTAQEVTSATNALPETYGPPSDPQTFKPTQSQANAECDNTTASRPYLKTPAVDGIKHMVGCSETGAAYTEIYLYSVPSTPPQSGKSPPSPPPPAQPQAPPSSPGAPPAQPNTQLQANAPPSSSAPASACFAKVTSGASLSSSSTSSTMGAPNANGQFEVDFPGGALQKGEWICVLDFGPGGNAMNASAALPIYVKAWSDAESKPPFGRVHLYLSGGVVFSQTNGQFSSQDLFFGLDVDSNWHRGGHVLVNTSFDAQLTSAPAATCQTSGSTQTPCSSSSSSAPSTSGFISSEKAGVIQGSLYMPVTSAAWRWSYGGMDNAFFFAPIAKAGVETLTSNTQATTSPAGTTTSVTVTGGNVYPFYSAGFRLGSFGMPHSWNKAPYLFSYFDATLGKWYSFIQCQNSLCSPPVNNTTTPPTVLAGNPTNLLFPLMIGLEGRLKIPKTPILIGFDSYTPATHAASVHGDLRFLFGVRLDVGCLYNSVTGKSTESVWSCTEGASSTSSTTPASSSAPSAPAPASSSTTKPST
jgi:hypothetical protein